jgi:chorismate synthase
MTEIGGLSENIKEVILKAKEKGDTVGGVITCNISGVPVGWGEPVFGKLQANLASAMLSINAAKGFEYGMGFEMAKKFGSEVNDIFTSENGKISTRTNYSGGIQGGISNGQDIYFRVAFKPVATLLQEQETVDKDGNPTVVKVRGRHDACVLPRAVPIVESMAAIVLADAYLLNRTSRL